jgi:hypothetical protein
MKILSNTKGTHKEAFGQLFEGALEVVISPYLAKDFASLFDEMNFEGLNNITLVTTLKKGDQDQLTKPQSLKSFYSTVHEKCPSAKVTVHVDNKLHGKIYIFKYAQGVKAIVTSANLTNNGLVANHEWGILIDVETEITDLLEDVLANIEYCDITELLVDRLLMFSDQYRRDNPSWSIIEKPTSDILNDVYFHAENSTQNPNYYLKPIGTSDRPILKEDMVDYSELHQRLDFSKKGTGAVRSGDILITTAIGDGSLLSYFLITGSPVEASFEDQQSDPDRARWPWGIEGRNQSVDFGGRWWDHDLNRNELSQRFLDETAGVLTKAGGKTLGTLNFGSDKVALSGEFGKFLVDEIDRVAGQTKNLKE